MENKGKITNIITYLFAIGAAISLMILCLYASVSAPTFSIPFYEYEYEKNGVYATIDIEQAELKTVTKHLLDYIDGKNDDLSIVATVSGEEREFFNEREISHMVDVKNLFVMGKQLRALSFCFLIAFMLAIFALKKNPFVYLAKASRALFSGIVAVLAVVGFAISLNFEQAFIKFHEIFFSNDLWQLDPSTDLLLNMVPLEFFMDIGAIVLALYVLFSVVIVVISSIYLSKKKKNGEKI